MALLSDTIEQGRFYGVANLISNSIKHFISIIDSHDIKTIDITDMDHLIYVY